MLVLIIILIVVGLAMQWTGKDTKEYIAEIRSHIYEHIRPYHLQRLDMYIWQMKASRACLGAGVMGLLMLYG
jgi:hypothetical protein